MMETIDLTETVVVKEDPQELCRLCANTDNQLMPIFKGEGIDHCISNKIEKYLPIIKISDTDKLPLQICYQCASTLIMWHSLYEGCTTADKKLRELVCMEEKLCQDEENFDQFIQDYPMEYEDNSQNSLNSSSHVDSTSKANMISSVEILQNEVEVVQVNETTIVEKIADKRSFIGNENNADSETQGEYIVAEKSVKDDATDNLTTLTCVVCNDNYTSGNLINDQFVCENCFKVKDESMHLEQDWSDIDGDAVDSSDENNTTPDYYARYTVYGDDGVTYLQCDKCVFFCELVSAFEAHYKIHSMQYEEEVFQCDLCAKVFTKKVSMISHLKNHQKKKKKILKCKICDATFKSMIRLKIHKKRHTRSSLDSTVIFCEVCRKYFKTKKGFIYHQQNICRKHKCYVCDETFSDGWALDDHIKSVHETKKGILLEPGVTELNVRNVTLPCDVAATTSNENETVMSACPICGKVVTQGVLPRHMILHSEERPFACDLCGKRFKRKHSLQDHIMIEMGMKNYVCDICGMKFLKQGYLNKHVRYHKLNNGEFQGFPCEMCGKRFPEKWRLGVHQRAVHKGGKFSGCKCDICGSMFAERWMVRLHKHVEHNGEEFKEYQCNICGKKFLEKWMIRSHQRTTHKGGVKKMYCDLCGRSDHLSTDCAHKEALQQVVCVLCGELCASTNFLKEHVMSVHSFEQSGLDSIGKNSISVDIVKQERELEKCVLYICAGCGKHFNNKQLLKAHETSENCTIETKYECPECEKVFYSKFSLSNHIMSHKKSEKSMVYCCEWCSKEFITREAYENHISLDKICLLCGKVYPCNEQLKNHVYGEHNDDVYSSITDGKTKNVNSSLDCVANTSKHSDNEPDGDASDKPYECKLCGKKFARKQAMKNHLFAEMNLRPYVCEFCDKSYNYYSHLKEHIVTNHGEKEFVCGYCGKDFPTKKRFRDHVTLHSDDKLHVCECGLKFKLSRYLNKHKKRCKMSGKEDESRMLGEEMCEKTIHCEEAKNKATVDCEAITPHLKDEMLANKMCKITTVESVDTYVAECRRCKTVDICNKILDEEFLCEKCSFSEALSLGKEKETKMLPDDYEKFVVLYKNGIKYMQCDQCQFICRPIVEIFEKHYRTHSPDMIVEDVKPEIPFFVDQPSSSIGATTAMVKEEVESYECDVCSKMFTNKKRLHKHLKIHQPKVYPCKKCDLSYETRALLLTHRKVHPSKKSVSFFCNMCGKSFKTKSGYNHHCANVCVEYKCEICNDVFLVKSVLRDHLKKVHNIEEGLDDVEEGQIKKETTSTVCPVCGKLVTENALTRHMNLHKEEKPYICDLCGKHFRIKWSLREHIMIEIGMKDYVCEICGKKFVIQAYLNKHMRFHMMCDGKFEGYQCEICGKKYAEEWKVKEHQRNSHKGKNLLRYKCDLCDKKFTRKWLVRSHKRTYHRDQYEEYQCNFCKKKFMEKWIIKLHLQTVHNVKNANEEDTSKPSAAQGTYVEIQKLLDLEVNRRISSEEGELMKEGGSAGKKPYECELCGKLFATKQGMKNHLYAELNLRKYVCEICGKRYNWWMGLKEHSIMNHGEKEYVCAFCGKDFPTKKRCKDHLSVHSDDRPYNCKCGNSFKLRRYLAKHQKRCGKTEGKIEIKKECDNLAAHEVNTFIVEEFLSRSSTNSNIVTSTSSSNATLEIITLHEEQSKVNLNLKKPADPFLPQDIERFTKTHVNGIKYMECDICSFICRPLVLLFSKHYKTHFNCEVEKTAESAEFEELLSKDETTNNCGVEKTAESAEFAELRSKKKTANNPLCTEQAPTPKIVEECDLVDSSCESIQCETCLRSFRKRGSYLRHLKIHERKIYNCRKCSCKFKSKLSFRSHKQQHVNKEKASYHCDSCGKPFKSKDGYKYHRANKCVQYSCRICEETYRTKAALQEHGKSKHNVSWLDVEDGPLTIAQQTSVCFVCGKVIKNVNLDRHMKIHDAIKPFVCDLCGKRFTFKSAIREHMMHKLGMKDYVCEICGRKFVKRCYLTKHIRFHYVTKEKHKQYKCDICSKLFEEKRMLVVHKRVSHDSEEPFSCDLCGKAYKSKITLRNHLMREVICLLCDEIFISNDLLKQHVFSIHDLEKYRKETNKLNDTQSSFVFPCEICGRRFASEDRYQQHNATEMVCGLCDTQFPSNTDLKIHIETVHNLQEYRKIMSLRWKKRMRVGNGESAEYTCNLCGKKLFYKRTLLLHMRMHSGLKPYKCEYCNKSYTSKHSLNAHLIAEMNLRKFVCSYCGKRYNFNSDLMVHVKQRHESRQFSCHVCGKEFGLLKYLKDHLTIHSQVKPFSCEKCNLGFRLRKFLLRHNRKYHLEGEEKQSFDVAVPSSG